MAANDIQVGGDHYNKYGELQPWAVLQEWFSEEEFRGFLRGDLMVYLIRYRDKGGIEDLKKASHVLGKLIEFEQSVAKPIPIRCTCFDTPGPRDCPKHPYRNAINR